MDAAARELEAHPAELRRRNLIRPEQMAPHQPYFGAGVRPRRLRSWTRVGAWRLEWFAARREVSRARPAGGRGLASFLEVTSGMAYEESASP